MPRDKDTVDLLADLYLTAEQRARAARTVASAAADADDCGRLLDILGLAPTDGVETRD